MEIEQAYSILKMASCAIARGSSQNDYAIALDMGANALNIVHSLEEENKFLKSMLRRTTENQICGRSTMSLSELGQMVHAAYCEVNEK